MTPIQRREIAKKLRELAELIDVAEDTDAALRQIATECCCHLFEGIRGTTTGGWLCPVHGRQF